jgi:hypothetical protein
VLPDGTLLKERSTLAGYVVYGGAQFHIPYPDEFTALGYAGEHIGVVPDGELAHIPDVPRNGTLLKEHSRPEIYVMWGVQVAHPQRASV